MADYKMNKIRAQALQSGVKQEKAESVSEKMRKLKPFAEVAGRPNAQYDNKKQRTWGLK